ncbi:PP2C family serine/threonine-protein phosphatase [Chloroflexus sp.]|uniref:PP2C family protein-serine/threonine phosphatase n=1 Tax=Chloroflexus sp. TaxID=1904827 RepID=UPI002ADDB597|nr:PP2C family serine/threonine-protein phosphatase [Chloroflexus sp.]
MRVRYSARTDVGQRREVNQDAYGSAKIDQGSLLVVCDGMGGHLAGEVASRLAVETIITSFRADNDPAEGLRQALISANQRVYHEGRGTMGTTAVAAFFWHNMLYVANVGDSRAYLVREGLIRQLTNDHSLIGDQVAAGLLTPEQARTSNIRNIITRAIGHQSQVEVDIFREPLLPGDTVVLSTDGMHGLLSDEEIAAIASMHPLDIASRRLVDEANARGGPDNITVVVAQVDGLEPIGHDTSAEAVTSPSVPVSPPMARPLSRTGLITSILILVLLVGLATSLLVTNEPSIPPLLSSPTLAATATLPPTTPTPLLRPTETP